MGKPDKQFTIQLRNARRLCNRQTARLGAMGSQSKVCFPLRFRLLADVGLAPFPASPLSRNRAADMAGLGPRPTELSDDWSRSRFGVRSGIDGRHGEDSFFDVPVVPFV